MSVYLALICVSLKAQEEVLGAHMVKREEELAKLVAQRNKLQSMQRQAELTYEKTEKVDMFRASTSI